MARTVADAFNQYHQQYVKPQMNARLTSSAAAATYATQASLGTKAELESPHFTGVPTAPTAGNDTDSTQIATTEFCQNLIRRLCGVDTKTIALLADLADALLNQPDFRTAVVEALDGKLNKTDAASTYLTKTDASNTYLAKKGSKIQLSDSAYTEISSLVEAIYIGKRVSGGSYIEIGPGGVLLTGQGKQFYVDSTGVYANGTKIG